MLRGGEGRAKTDRRTVAVTYLGCIEHPHSSDWLCFAVMFTVRVLVPVPLLLSHSVSVLVCNMKSVFRLKENK